MDLDKPVPKKRVYIHLPKKHMAGLAKHYELNHGLIIKQMNTNITKEYLKAYFREWGTVTACKTHLGDDQTLAYVRFCSEDEADKADWAGPHIIGGTEVETKRVVSPKIEDDSDEEITTHITRPPPRRSLGLGYILEDASWLDDA